MLLAGGHTQENSTEALFESGKGIRCPRIGTGTAKKLGLSKCAMHRFFGGNSIVVLAETTQSANRVD
jgi:hypothetical protein